MTTGQVLSALADVFHVNPLLAAGVVGPTRPALNTGECPDLTDAVIESLLQLLTAVLGPSRQRPVRWINVGFRGAPDGHVPAGPGDGDVNDPMRKSHLRCLPSIYVKIPR
jgi:hypothetical protein